MIEDSYTISTQTEAHLVSDKLSFSPEKWQTELKFPKNCK